MIRDDFGFYLIAFNSSILPVSETSTLDAVLPTRDHRFSRLEKGKGNTDLGKNRKRKNTLYNNNNIAYKILATK
uniref:Uncharacterized protein n=1 Tax=Megaselia scalaris TaxID=36166 RepID=T1GKZ7_MEGSC